MNNQFFANNRQPTRRTNNYNYGQQNSYPRTRNSMNFTDNFSDFQASFHNSTMRPTNKATNHHHHNLNNNNFMNKDLNHSVVSNEKSFSSFFDLSTSFQASGSNKRHSDNSSECSSSGNYSLSNYNALNVSDDDGVYLQISNLDQWYDETSLKNYLMNQLKPITPILSLTIETPSIAKVKVPSVQFAKQVVSHLHRKKMGHKRIFVSFLKDKTSAECSALRNKVIGLLRDVPSHQLPMSKFRELFQSRFKSSISILDLYRMGDICTISVNCNDEKIISLESDATKTEEIDTVLKMDQHSVSYCVFHYKPDKNKGWAEIEIEALPNVFMTIEQVKTMIQSLLQVHQGDIPVASLLYCLEAELNINVQPNERGVSLEHLVSCIPNITIRNNDFGIKILSWRDDNSNNSNSSDNTSISSSTKYMMGKVNLNTSCSVDTSDSISKEVIELIRMCPKSTMQFSKFIPTYHNHFGKQCRVADYGCTKLIELFEAMASIVQVLGEGESRQITLTHRIQIRRFTTDLLKILRNQPSKSLYVSNLSQLFVAAHNRQFDVTDYGVCDISDLLDGLRHSNCILVNKLREPNADEDYILSLQKRRQTNNEVEKTCIFSGEVVELLRNAPQFTIPFRKFVRSYHYYYGYQCKLSDYGYMRLAELLDALSGIVEMDQTNEENRRIFLSRKIALRIFSEQIYEIITSINGSANLMIKVDELMDMHKNKFGYQMQGSSLGYQTVIDAMKFVPFIELNSYENELWLISHLQNKKFRQRSMLACLAIIDVGVKVPLSKFHVVFNEKFKFNIHEKTLHAMKHAVEIEMVNGIKMISITPMMKFIMHIVNIVEQRKIMNIQEIKSIMKLNFSACFNFGYPNLSTMLEAFPDVFSGTKVGVHLFERSDIELNSECPLIPSGLQKLLSANQVQTIDEKPEIYRSKSSIGPIGYNPNRKVMNPSIGSGNKWCNNINNNNHNDARNIFIQPTAYARNYHNNCNQFYGDTSAAMMMDNNGNNNNSFYGYNKNNNNNKVDEQQQQQQGSSSWYERNLKFQQQQQMQALKRDFWNNSTNTSGNNNSSSSTSHQQQYSAYESNMQHQLGMMSAHNNNNINNNRFEVPKPDTPTKPLVWFDPIWKNDNGMFDFNRNPTTDSLKSLNVHVISPFLSFNMKTMFTFDNVNANAANTSNNNNNGSNNQMM